MSLTWNCTQSKSFKIHSQASYYISTPPFYPFYGPSHTWFHHGSPPIKPWLMWVKQCHKPPLAGNGKDTTCKNGDDWGMVYECLWHCFTNIIRVLQHWVLDVQRPSVPASLRLEEAKQKYADDECDSQRYTYTYIYIYIYIYMGYQLINFSEVSIHIYT